MPHHPTIKSCQKTSCNQHISAPGPSTPAHPVPGQGINVTNAGGAGYKAWEVVKGHQDAYVHVTLIKKWDICAPQAILASLKVLIIPDHTSPHTSQI